MYKYEEMRPYIFTEEGVEMLQRIRENVNLMINLAGSVRLQEAIHGTIGDSWLMLACIDYMVEKGEIVPVGESVVTQHRVFVKQSIC